MAAKKIVFLLMIVLIVVSTSVLSTNKAAAAAFPTSRDPLIWPFPADSIWNMPIHNNAVYVPAGIGNHMPASGPTTDWEPLMLQPNAPKVNIITSTSDWDGTSRCNANLGGTLLSGVPISNTWSNGDSGPGNTPNNSAALIMPDGVTVIETQPLQVCSNGGRVTSHYVWPSYNIKTADGIAGSHGGSGMSALGGSLRVGELMPGSVIHHALKMNFYAKYVYSWTGGGYRWPAPHVDSYASASAWGGSVPAMREGSLVALKPSFNVASLKTVPGQILAQALMDYGAYAVDDTAWDVFAIDTQDGPLGNAETEFHNQYGYDIGTQGALNCTATTNDCKWNNDLWTILQNLNVVDNNSPTTIGGGPNSDTVNRRAPMAPPFVGGATATPAGPTNTPTNTSVPPTATNTPAGGTWTNVDDAATGWIYTGAFGSNIVNNANDLGGTQRDPYVSGDSAIPHAVINCAFSKS